jgi:hypothetical protein
MRALSRVIVAVLLALSLGPEPALAQQRLVIVGVVQWVTTNRVQLMSDAGVSVSIDVSRLDQGSYTGLRGGDRVRVIGVVSADRARLVAESLEPAEAGGGFWNVFPQTP